MIDTALKVAGIGLMAIGISIMGIFVKNHFEGLRVERNFYLGSIRHVYELLIENIQVQQATIKVNQETIQTMRDLQTTIKDFKQMYWWNTPAQP